MTSKATLRPHPAYGFLQVQPTPSPEEIEEYYKAEFYSGDYQRLNDSSLEVQLADADFYDSQRADICAGIEEVLGRPVAGISLLDVGCGWGGALRYFAAQGIECAGFDPAPEAVSAAQAAGLDVVLAGVDRMDVFGGRRFDAVTLLNVLEHLADPVGILRQLRDDVLRPGGVVVIDVPNEFNAFQTAGRSVHDLPEWWVAAPAHLNYFSGSTLRRLLEGEGFEVGVLRASFPLEMFLLMGENYVADPALGRQCHERRVAFEANLRSQGQSALLDDLYRWLASRDLGRQVCAIAKVRAP